MSLIWKNARDYNEDGSEIYNVSLELEVSYHSTITRCLKDLLTEPGILQQASRRSEGQGGAAAATPGEADHVECHTSTQATAEAQAEQTEPRLRS